MQHFNNMNHYFYDSAQIHVIKLRKHYNDQ